MQSPRRVYVTGGAPRNDPGLGAGVASAVRRGPSDFRFGIRIANSRIFNPQFKGVLAASIGSTGAPSSAQVEYLGGLLRKMAIPRRVYTQAHMDVVAESVAAVYDARDRARGLRMVFEPKHFRFFQAQFEPLA